MAREPVYLDWTAGGGPYAELRSNPATKVSPTETARGAGVDSQYAFTGLLYEDYVIRLQEGESPADTDPVIGSIDSGAAAAQATLAATEVAKVPRAATALDAGKYRLAIDGGEAANITPLGPVE